MRLRLAAFGLILFAFSALAHATIYGEDDRRDVDSSVPAAIQAQADAVATLILRNGIQPAGKDEVKIDSDPLGKAFGLCPAVRYFDEPTAGDCSGFLITPTRIATAGHCIDEQARCPNMAWAFDYRVDKIAWDGQKVTLKTKNIYNCKRILARKQTEHLDYAVIELDRAVTDRAPLDVQEYPEMQPGDAVYGLGFPSGMPMKWESEGRVRQQDGRWIRGEIDTFYYNSGSPIFSSDSHKVIGILIDGDEDYHFDHRLQCSLPVRCPLDGCQGESFISAEVLAPYLQNQYSPQIATSTP